MEIAKALTLLERLLDEVPRLKRLPHNNLEFTSWDQRVKEILIEIFGKQSNEYARYDGIIILKHVHTEEEKQQAYVDHINQRENALSQIIKKCETSSEKGLDKKTEPIINVPIDVFDLMQFHPKIIESSKSLFETGHYAQAIFEAYKAVCNFVKEKTTLELDGKDLMAKVFNEKQPIIKLNNLRTESEKDEQEGFRFLFMGAMVGIRNPKAHDNIVQTDPYRTLEYLSLASLLIRRIEEGKLNKDVTTKTI